MGTLAFGEALAGALGEHLRGARAHAPRKSRSGAPHPTGAPVLRDSVEAGTFEHLFFVSPAKGETDRLLRAARRILDAGRQLRREARCDGRILTPAEQRLTTLTAASVPGTLWLIARMDFRAPPPGKDDGARDAAPSDASSDAVADAAALARVSLLGATQDTVSVTEART